MKAFLILVLICPSSFAAIVKSNRTTLSVKATATPASKLIGPQPVASTALALGTIFASPSGSGTSCTQAAPCDVSTAVGKAQAGAVVFLRGGRYVISRNLSFGSAGTATQPITIESYPGELAIFDGSDFPALTDITIFLTGSYYRLRKFEIKNQPKWSGIVITGSNNLLDGMNIHHNYSSGITINSNGSKNTIRNTRINDNSGVGVPEFGDGGNTDGVSISSGDGNRIEYCEALRNSDDGIDTWVSTNSFITHSIAAANGLGVGNGNGFKLGGPTGANTLIEHSLAYNNIQIGFDVNGGQNVIIRFNTAWGNKRSGYFTYTTTTTQSNISLADRTVISSNGGVIQNNSWQRNGTVSFISTDPNSPDFLRPTSGGGFTDIGAYGGL